MVSACTFVPSVLTSWCLLDQLPRKSGVCQACRKAQPISLTVIECSDLELPLIRDSSFLPVGHFPVRPHLVKRHCFHKAAFWFPCLYLAHLFWIFFLACNQIMKEVKSNSSKTCGYSTESRRFHARSSVPYGIASHFLSQYVQQMGQEPCQFEYS